MSEREKPLSFPFDRDLCIKRSTSAEESHRYSDVEILSGSSIVISCFAKHAAYIVEACNSYPKLTFRVAELEKAIKDFSCEMAISYSEPRLRYYELQVACSAYDDFKAFAAALNHKEK